MGKTFDTKEYETKLQRVYARIYEALSTLRSEGFIYTDLKPQNILIDSNSNAYLIDLESVIQNQLNKQVCVYTGFYFPPDLRNKFPLVVPDDMERILSWTFCFSVYQSACVRADVSNQQSFAKWYQFGGEFLKYFQCERPISSQLSQMLNSCLSRRTEKSSFSNLRRTEWLLYDLAWIHVFDKKTNSTASSFIKPN